MWIYKVYATTGSTVASALAMASAFAPQVYVVAGLAMLVWLKEEPGELETSSAGARGEPALVPAEG